MRLPARQRRQDAKKSLIVEGNLKCCRKYCMVICDIMCDIMVEYRYYMCKYMGDSEDITLNSCMPKGKI